MSMHPETWERELNNPEDKARWAKQFPHLSRSAEFHDSANTYRPIPNTQKADTGVPRKQPLGPLTYNEHVDLEAEIRRSRGQ